MRHIHRFWVMFAASSVALVPAPSNAQSNTTIRSFFQDNSPDPFLNFHADWAYGMIKAQCSSADGPVVGLSRLINDYQEVPNKKGHARAALCQSPFANGSPLYFSDTSGNAANTQTFLTSDSPAYGTHVAFDWDPGYHKGECAGNTSFVIGVAQTPGSLELGKLLCSSSSGYYTTGGVCDIEDFSATHAACLSGRVMVGVSSDPSTHKPHRLLCCDIRPIIQ